MHGSMMTTLTNPHMHMHKGKIMHLIILRRSSNHLMGKVARVTPIRSPRELRVCCLATS